MRHTMTYSNVGKKSGPWDYLQITLYPIICHVASTVSPGDVVVIIPDWNPGDVGSSPSWGISLILFQRVCQSMLLLILSKTFQALVQEIARNKGTIKYF